MRGNPRPPPQLGSRPPRANRVGPTSGWNTARAGRNREEEAPLPPPHTNMIARHRGGGRGGGGSSVAEKIRYTAVCYESQGAPMVRDGPNRGTAFGSSGALHVCGRPERATRQKAKEQESKLLTRSCQPMAAAVSYLFNTTPPEKPFQHSRGEGCPSWRRGRKKPHRPPPLICPVQEHKYGGWGVPKPENAGPSRPEMLRTR